MPGQKCSSNKALFYKTNQKDRSEYDVHLPFDKQKENFVGYIRRSILYRNRTGARRHQEDWFGKTGAICRVVLSDCLGRPGLCLKFS